MAGRIDPQRTLLYQQAQSQKVYAAVRYSQALQKFDELPLEIKNIKMWGNDKQDLTVSDPEKSSSEGCAFYSSRKVCCLTFVSLFAGLILLGMGIGGTNYNDGERAVSGIGGGFLLLLTIGLCFKHCTCCHC